MYWVELLKTTGHIRLIDMKLTKIYLWNGFTAIISIQGELEKGKKYIWENTSLKNIRNNCYNTKAYTRSTVKLSMISKDTRD